MNSRTAAGAMAARGQGRSIGALTRLGVLGIPGLSTPGVHGDPIDRLARAVNWAFYSVYALLLMRAVLSAIEGSPSSGPARLVRYLAAPLEAPVRLFLEYPLFPNIDRMVVPIGMAAIGFALLHAGIRDALHLLALRREGSEAVRQFTSNRREAA